MNNQSNVVGITLEENKNNATYIINLTKCGMRG